MCETRDCRCHLQSPHCARIQCGQVVKVLVDSGASHNFVASQLVTHLSLPCEQDAGVSVVLGNGSRQDGSLLVPALTYRIGSFKDTRAFRVTKLSNYDLILGKPWLTTLNPDIDWVSNIVRLRKGTHTYVLAPKHLSPGAEEVGLISALQLKRLLRSGAQAYLAVLTETKEEAKEGSAEEFLRRCVCNRACPEGHYAGAEASCAAAYAALQNLLWSASQPFTP